MRRNLPWIVINVLALALLIVIMSWGATETINTVPSANSTFVTDLQSFLRGEEAGRDALKNNLTDIKVISGGIGSTSAGLSHTISACVAFPGGYYAQQDSVSHTYTASKRTFVFIRANTSTSVTIGGAAVTYDGNFVFAEMSSGSDQPTTPSNCLTLFYVDTSGVAITEVDDLREISSASIPDPLAVDQGATGDSNTIKYYYDAIGTSDSATIHLRHKSGTTETLYTFETTDDYSGNTEITWEFERGAKLNIGSGVSIALDFSTIRADPTQQIFTGSGQVYNVGSNVFPYRWFGDATSTTFQKAVDSVVASVDTSKFCTITGSGFMDCDSGVTVDTKAIHIKGDNFLWERNSSYLGNLLVVQGCTLSDGGEYDPRASTDQNSFEITGCIFEGNERETAGNGLVFRGENKRFFVGHNKFYNIKGSAIIVGDKDGTDGDDSTNQLINEALFLDNEVWNSGATDDTDAQAAIEIGRNNTGTGDVNNIWFDNFRVYYSRYISIAIRNLNTSGSAPVHDIHFRALRVHGNDGISGTTDDNGASWRTDTHLIVIGDTTATLEEDIRPVFFNDAEVISNEINCYAIYVSKDCGVNANDIYVSGGGSDGRRGIHFDQSQSSYVQLRHKTFSDGNLEGAISIGEDGLYDSSAHITLGPVGGTFHTDNEAMVNYDSGESPYLIHDSNQVNYYAYKDIDAAATTSSGSSTFARFGLKEYFRRAYFVPDAALTANKGNYAILNISFYNSSGVSQDVISINTTSGSTGTGNWTARVGELFPDPTSDEATGGDGWTAGFEVKKFGSGVVVPSGLLILEMSKGIRYVD